MKSARNVWRTNENMCCRTLCMTANTTLICSSADTTQTPAAQSPACQGTSSAKLARSSPLTALTLTSDMSVATAKSSHSRLTRPRAAANMLQAPPSAGSSGVPAVSAPAALPDLCECGKKIIRRVPDQIRCNTCRQIQLRKEFTQDPLELAAFRRLRDSWPHDDHDWQLHDPDHPEVIIWASDLAARYRQQTEPRPIRNSIQRWY